MSKQKKDPYKRIHTLEQFQKQLDKGRFCSFHPGRNEEQELMDERDDCVLGFVDAKVILDALVDLKVTVAVCLFPSCSPGWYMFREGNKYCSDHMVEIKWVNRPLIPVIIL